MSRVRVMILRAAGINCDLEAQHAWELAGAEAERIHVRRVIENPGTLSGYQVLMIPGGFSYGDDIAAGRIFATQLKRHLLDAVREFVGRGRLVLGVCNGFQVLVNAGLLPVPENGTGGGRSGSSARGSEGAGRVCTISYNEPPGFQDRWVNLRATASNCAFLEAGREYEMPIAHGEGRVLFAGDETLHQVLSRGLNALTYVASPAYAGVAPGTPVNPNGSVADIAGLCDPTGRILGLMPHPERFVSWTQHPCWTSDRARLQGGRSSAGEGDGLALFRRAMVYLS